MPVEEKRKKKRSFTDAEQQAAQRVCVQCKACVLFLAGLECIGHAFDVKQHQQQHMGLSHSTSVNLTLIIAVQGEISAALTRQHYKWNCPKLCDVRWTNWYSAKPLWNINVVVKWRVCGVSLCLMLMPAGFHCMAGRSLHSNRWHLYSGLLKGCSRPWTVREINTSHQPNSLVVWLWSACDSSDHFWR